MGSGTISNPRPWVIKAERPLMIGAALILFIALVVATTIANFLPGG